MIEHLHYGTKSAYTPSKVKNVIATFNPMFSGHAQHDSGEFLNFFLDTLHEDLNLVKNKPYMNWQEPIGGP